MEQWYAVNTQPRRESQAVLHLANQGFETYLPQYLRTRRHARRVDTVQAPLFPSYLFIRFDSAIARWRSIRSTIGVRDLVRNGDEPAQVPAEIVAELRERENATGLIVMAPRFRAGDRVTVCYGAFLDQTGIFECASDEERVTILLHLLGRQVRVRLPTTAVELV
jgi:transcriptional antiterminator RfaH